MYNHKIKQHFLNCSYCSMMALLLWLTVLAVTFHVSQAQCAGDGEDSAEDGAIRVTGIQTADVVAGSLEICTGREWRAVCQGGWDADNTAVVCRQLGFSSEGSSFCRDSCLGRKEQPGLYGFGCTGKEHRLAECLESTTRNENCGNAAGVICINMATAVVLPTTSTKPSDPMTTESESSVPSLFSTTEADLQEPGTSFLVTTEPASQNRFTTTTGNTNVEASMMESSSSLTALGGGLGTLTAILAILLVGVVTAWVWSCHKNARKLDLQSRKLASPQEALLNPTYDTHTSSVQYSSCGPDQSSSHSNNKVTFHPASSGNKKQEAPSTEGEGIYHIVESPDDCEESEYAEVPREDDEEEQTYEVPLSSVEGIVQSVSIGMEYSTLQHK